MLVAACSGGGGDGSGSPEEVSGASPGTVVEPSGAAVPELGDPVAERSIVADGWTITLAMFALQGDTGGLVLNARLTYDEAGPEQAPTDVLSADNAFSNVMGTPNGFRLIDKAGGKVYLPARDEDDATICSPDMGGERPEVGDQVYVSCVFGAPAEGTESVDVRAAAFGVFTGVPIQ